MELSFMIILFIFIVSIGMLVKHFFGKRIFYYFHAFEIIVVLGGSIIYDITSPQTGASWPWWSISMFYIPFILFSLIFGAVQDSVKK